MSKTQLLSSPTQRNNITNHNHQRRQWRRRRCRRMPCSYAGWSRKIRQRRGSSTLLRRRSTLEAAAQANAQTQATASTIRSSSDACEPNMPVLRYCLHRWLPNSRRRSRWRDESLAPLRLLVAVPSCLRLAHLAAAATLLLARQPSRSRSQHDRRTTRYHSPSPSGTRHGS